MFIVYIFEYLKLQTIQKIQRTWCLILFTSVRCVNIWSGFYEFYPNASLITGRSTPGTICFARCMVLLPGLQSTNREKDKPEYRGVKVTVTPPGRIHICLFFLYPPSCITSPGHIDIYHAESHDLADSEAHKNC